MWICTLSVLYPWPILCLCHIKNRSCILPHYKQTLSNKLKLSGSEACQIIDYKANLFWWRQNLHFVVTEWTVDLTVVSGRRRTALPLENVLFEGLSYVQKSQYQNNYYLTWQNLINYSVFLYFVSFPSYIPSLSQRF